MSNQLKEEAMTLFQQGRHEEALETFQQAALSYAEIGDDVGRGEMLNNVGVVQRVRREYAQSAATLNEARQLFQRAGDRNREAQTLGNLGDLYAAQGDGEQAMRHYSESAALFAEDGDRQKQSQVLRTLGLYHLRRREIATALMVMDRSYEVLPRPNIFQRIFHALLRFAMKLYGGG